MNLIERSGQWEGERERVERDSCQRKWEYALAVVAAFAAVAVVSV